MPTGQRLTKINSRKNCIYSRLFFLDYNDYLTNYSSSEVGNKDRLSKSRINSPYACCIKESVTSFNISLNQLSYITGISFQGDSNTDKFIESFQIKYLRHGSLRRPIHDVWYFSYILDY